MTKHERVLAARGRLQALYAKVADAKAREEAHAKASEQVKVERDRLRKIAGRRPMTVQRPGETLFWPDGMRLSGAYMEPSLREACGTSVAKWTEAVVNGAVGLNANATAMKAKGFAQRARYITRADVRTVEAAKKREVRAAEAYRKAQQETRSAILAAWTAGEKVPVEDVANLMGRYYAATAKVEAVRPMDSWQKERLLGDIEEAKKHLAAMQTSGFCGCHTCFLEQQKVEREKAQKEAAKRPRYVWTCPTHGHKVVSLINEDRDGEKTVRCQFTDYLVAAVKPRKVPLSTPLGVVSEVA